MDAMRLLGSLMENRSTPAATDRLNNAYQQAAGSGPLGDLLARFGGPQTAGAAGGAGAGGLAGMLGGLLGQAGGGQQGSGQQGIGGLFGGLADMAKRAAGTAGTELQRNNPAAVGGAGALAGALLGGGRGAIGGGVLAVLGSLAVNAIQEKMLGREEAAAPAPAPQQPARTDQPASAAATAGMAGYHQPEDVHRKALLMLRAMIQAAKCDGQIDPQEMTRILGELDQSGEGPEARAYVLKEMTAPVDIDGLAGAVTSPTEAAEVYAASLMAIEVDSQAERDYLARLAGALRISPEVVAHINSTLNVRV